jgi:hypothetical protein
LWFDCFQPSIVTAVHDIAPLTKAINDLDTLDLLVCLFTFPFPLSTVVPRQVGPKRGWLRSEWGEHIKRNDRPMPFSINGNFNHDFQRYYKSSCIVRVSSPSVRPCRLIVQCRDMGTLKTSTDVHIV